MTERETNLLERNFKLNVTAIITLVCCTASFVWFGAQYTNEIKQSVYVNHNGVNRNSERLNSITQQVHRLNDMNTDHEIRLSRLEH